MSAPWVRLLRPHQYTKNLLVFAAPGAAARLDEGDTLLRAITAFALFCAISSAGYVVNDLTDASADRQHPEKRPRPIASGAVSEKVGRNLLVALLVVTAAIAPTLGGWFVLATAGYAITTFSYSLALKQVPWLELVLVSSGFVVRAAAGAAATDVEPSGWFLVVVSAGALLVIAGKRLGELVTLGQDTLSRPVLRHYSASSLQFFAGASAATATVAYAAWAIADASNRAGDDRFLRLTIVPFVAALLRYLDLCRRGRGEAPDVIVFRDPWMLLAGVVWVALYATGLYS